MILFLYDTVMVDYTVLTTHRMCKPRVDLKADYDSTISDVSSTATVLPGAGCWSSGRQECLGSSVLSAQFCCEPTMA